MSVAAATEERQQVRQLAREFAEAELRPNVERWDHERSLDPDTLPHLAELGFFGMLVPEAHGGLGFDLPTWAAALEELAWGEPAVALILANHTAYGVLPLLRHGTDAQKQRWLADLAAGDAIACLALAEPDAGWELPALETTARRDGDGWLLEGHKKWVAHGRGPGLAAVVARSGDVGAEAPSVFLVPTSADGYAATTRENTMGLRAVEIVGLHLHGLRVDGDALLGEAPGRAADQLDDAVEVGRVGMAAIALGIARAALEHALRYADEREQFGRKLRGFEGIQAKLADMALRVEAASAVLERAAAAPSRKLAAMAKLEASEAAMLVSTEAVQIFGGYGYMRDYPVEKLMRDAKATQIDAGPNEVLREIVAAELYGA